MNKIKNTSELEDVQSKKENRALASLLFIGFVGSACVHAAAMITPVPTLWKPVSKESEDIMEFVVDTTKTPEEKTPEIAKEPEPIVKLAANQPSEEVAPAAIALAPETTTPLKEGKDAPAPDNLKPLLTISTSDIKIHQGGGSIISKDGTGSGFGKSKIPTGFVLGGKVNGNPNGSKNGVIDGFINGKLGGKNPQGTSTLPPASTTPIDPPKKRQLNLECLSCPKPQYRGKEGTPRVTYDIAPDGRVTNVRLRQSSGDEQTDRETIEAMSKWQFNPQTIPEGGRTNVKVRVTFEEQGSQFQRQNEERRREAQKLAEQERQQREAERSLPAPTAITPVNNPTPDIPPASTLAPAINPPPASPQPGSATDTPTSPKPTSVTDAPVSPQPASVTDTPASPKPTSVTDAPPPAAPTSTPPPPPPLSEK
jgi:TonB family protein